jgi:hypothetical protein
VHATTDRHEWLFAEDRIEAVLNSTGLLITVQSTCPTCYRFHGRVAIFNFLLNVEQLNKIIILLTFPFSERLKRRYTINIAVISTSSISIIVQTRKPTRNYTFQVS